MLSRSATAGDQEAQVANPWKAAREASGLSGQSVYREQIRRGVPDDELIDPTKLSRLERDRSAKPSASALAVLADIYGKRLVDIDPEAATRFRAMRDLVGRLSGWVTADEGHLAA
jgi:hypothetical protein